MDTVVYIGFAILTVSIGCSLYRILVGPTIIDRIIAFDTIAICTVAMIVLLSVLWQSPHYLEVVIIFALLGFVSTVGFTFFLYRTYDPHEQEDQEPRSPSAREKGDKL